MRIAVYITRGDHWCFEAREKTPIAEAEWVAYVKNDPEFAPLHSMPGRRVDTGEMINIPMRGHWEWLPARTSEVGPKTFEYDRGGIIVRCPSFELLTKARAVALALQATVIGDDGEVWPRR